MDTTKSLDELRRELEDLKAIHEQEKRILEQCDNELYEAQARTKLRVEEKQRLDSKLNEMLMRVMMHSESNLAELVLKGIAEIEGTLNEPDKAVVEKDKQIAELDKDFTETLSKLSGLELDQELERAQKEEEKLNKLVRERETELQRLKDIKVKNRQEYGRRKKEHRQKINQLTERYNELHSKLMKKKYGASEASESAELLDDE